jgi:hypothetical protein
MAESVITLGTITLQQRAEESYENYTISNKKSVGRIIPFHVTDDRVDLRIGYALFINGERDIRTLSVQKEYDTFGRLIHGLRLAILPLPGDSHKLYAELKQAYPKELFTRHETLHPTLSEIDLDQGARISVFAELKKVGTEVGTKKELLNKSGVQSSYLCIRFSKDNLWAPIIAYVATRIMPIANGYSGS